MRVSRLFSRRDYQSHFFKRQLVEQRRRATHSEGFFYPEPNEQSSFVRRSGGSFSTREQQSNLWLADHNSRYGRGGGGTRSFSTSKHDLSKTFSAGFTTTKQRRFSSTIPVKLRHPKTGAGAFMLNTSETVYENDFKNLAIVRPVKREERDSPYRWPKEPERPPTQGLQSRGASTEYNYPPAEERSVVSFGREGSPFDHAERDPPEQNHAGAEQLDRKLHPSRGGEVGPSPGSGKQRRTVGTQKGTIRRDNKRVQTDDPPATESRCCSPGDPPAEFYPSVSVQTEEHGGPPVQDHKQTQTSTTSKRSQHTQTADTLAETHLLQVQLAELQSENFSLKLLAEKTSALKKEKEEADKLTEVLKRQVTRVLLWSMNFFLTRVLCSG